MTCWRALQMDILSAYACTLLMQHSTSSSCLAPVYNVRLVGMQQQLAANNATAQLGVIRCCVC